VFHIWVLLCWNVFFLFPVCCVFLSYFSDIFNQMFFYNNIDNCVFSALSCLDHCVFFFSSC
jgi:hypothetical protein